MVRTALGTVTSSRRWTTVVTLVTAAAMAGSAAFAHRSTAAEPGGRDRSFSNPAGVHRTIATAGAMDNDNPFFQDLGSNGRSCFTCHRPAQGWTITPAELRERFDTTGGLDPVFRVNDGSNCQGADVSTLEKRRNAFSLLLTRGVIRIDLQVPAGAEFDVIDVDDPYDCGAPLAAVSMYRRPLPTTNLGFLSAVMWDGRQTAPGLPGPRRRVSVSAAARISGANRSTSNPSAHPETETAPTSPPEGANTALAAQDRPAVNSPASAASAPRRISSS